MLGLTTTPSLSQQNDLFGALEAGNVPILDWQAYGANMEITEPPVWLTPETQMGMTATAKAETNAWTTQAARLAASEEAIIIGDYTILKDPEGNLIAAQEAPEAPDTYKIVDICRIIPWACKLGNPSDLALNDTLDSSIGSLNLHWDAEVSSAAETSFEPIDLLGKTTARWLNDDIGVAESADGDVIMLARPPEGDILVIWSLDSIGTSSN